MFIFGWTVYPFNRGIVHVQFIWRCSLSVNRYNLFLCDILILSITIVLLVRVLCFSCSVFLFSVIALAIWNNFVMPIKHLREREWAKVRLDCISLFQCASDWFCWTWGADEGRLFTPTLLLFLYYNFLLGVFLFL